MKHFDYQYFVKSAFTCFRVTLAFWLAFPTSVNAGEFIEPWSRISHAVFDHPFRVGEHGFGVMDPSRFDQPNDGYSVSMIQVEPPSEIARAILVEHGRYRATLRNSLPSELDRIEALEIYMIAGEFIADGRSLYVTAFVFDTILQRDNPRRLIAFFPTSIEVSAADASAAAYELSRLEYEGMFGPDGGIDRLRNCRCSNGEPIPEKILQLIPSGVIEQVTQQRQACLSRCKRDLVSALVLTGLTYAAAIGVGVAVPGVAGLYIGLAGSAVPWVGIPVAIWEYRSCKFNCEYGFCRAGLSESIGHYYGISNKKTAERLIEFQRTCWYE